jgi:translation initiation factor IF-3
VLLEFTPIDDAAPRGGLVVAVRGLQIGVRVFRFGQRFVWLSQGFSVGFSLRGTGDIQDNAKRVRVNRQIRISPIRVIAADGSQLGIMDVDAALTAAQEQGLDLVEVAPMARPPVARIMDYGKFKFEQAKMARQAKKKQHVIHLKEVKYRPGIEDHDFETKTRHAREFLQDGNKVKVTMMFRGRQIAHPELGKEVVDRVAAALNDIAKVESDAKLEGKSMIMILTPR